MKTEDNIDTLFKDLDGQFDVASPNLHHKQRFLAKLKHTEIQETPTKKTYTFIKPIIAVAASLLLILSLTFTLQSRSNTTTDLASVSPEMAKTQSFFTTTIAYELKQLEKEDAPEVQPLIQDALKQLSILEADYEKLKLDLNKSGNDKRVIYAMIANFQNRIEILESVMQTIDEVKQFKNISHENQITI